MILIRCSNRRVLHPRTRSIISSFGRAHNGKDQNHFLHFFNQSLSKSDEIHFIRFYGSVPAITKMIQTTLVSSSTAYSLCGSRTLFGEEMILRIRVRSLESLEK